LKQATNKSTKINDCLKIKNVYLNTLSLVIQTDHKVMPLVEKMLPCWTGQSVHEQRNVANRANGLIIVVSGY